MRENAIRTLGLIGPGAMSGEPAVREALKDVNEAVRSAASNALEKITGAEPNP